MPRFLGLGRFFGSTVSNAGGYAAGSAVAHTLTPGLQDVTNAAWRAHPSMPLDAFALAEGVAQGQVGYDWAQNESENTGVGKERFDVLVDIASTGPGVGEAYRMWRRREIDEAGFRRAVRRAGLEREWIDALVRLRWETLTPGELSAAIHRGLVPDPGLLKGEQPGPDRKVESYPVYPIDAEKEAAAHGYDHNHLGVLVGLQGLPMGVIEAANAYFRGIITHDDYIAAFNESNNRNEWAEAVLAYARQIPTTRDFFENALRGHHSLEWAQDQAKRHGMSDDDALVFWQNQGRAMNLHQITQALAYGARYNPAPTDIQDPYVAAVKLGPLRPEFEELAESLKYLLPSAMYFRTLQTQGVLTEEQARTWYLRMGWPPELAEQVAHAFAHARASAEKEATATDLLTLFDGGRATELETLAALRALGYPDDEARRKLDLVDARRVASAKGTAITDIHAKYKKGSIDADVAVGAIQQLGVPAWAANAIVQAWAYAVGAVEPSQ